MEKCWRIMVEDEEEFSGFSIGIIKFRVVLKVWNVN
jgi:hypothetical protein